MCHPRSVDRRLRSWLSEMRRGLLHGSGFASEKQPTKSLPPARISGRRPSTKATLCESPEWPTTPNSYFKLSLADGSNNYTTEAGGVAELRARLVDKPKNYTTGMAPCLFAIATSDPTEAAVLYPSVLVMTPENAATEHPVRVVGLWDKTADGDVEAERSSSPWRSG